MTAEQRARVEANRAAAKARREAMRQADRAQDLAVRAPWNAGGSLLGSLFNEAPVGGRGLDFFTFGS